MTAPFELLGPLPTGRLAIEASAGTGKTYALSTLAVRFLVEAGTAPGELLVVTFTRAAAAELRDRVRDRLAEVARALELVATDGLQALGEAPDEVVRHLCAEDLHRRLARARQALAEFDATTITTIHGFAVQVLAGLGLAAPADPDASFADDRGMLLHQVLADELTRLALGHDGTAEAPKLDELARVVDAVVANPGAALAPGLDEPGAAGDHRRLVDRVLAELARRRRRSGRLGFDDLLVVLRDVVTADDATAALLGRRHPVVLIDEFQDTDPVQWEAFAALTGATPGGTTVLVGDPKQAIYGFRGADVHTYLEAVGGDRTTRTSLATNWRSDGAVLTSIATLLRGATFGDAGIGFREVEPSPPRAGTRLVDDDGAPLPALSLRLVTHPDHPRSKGSKGRPGRIRADDAARAIWADLAEQVRELLETARIPDEEATTPGAVRALTPRDVAVLVTTNAQGPQVREALRRAGIPAVISRGDPVLAAPAAYQLRVLLEALLRPTDPGRARALCIGWFVGWRPEQLVTATEVDLAPIHDRLHRWSELLGTHGLPELVRAVWAETAVTERLLGSEEGERSLTDLDHLVELLTEAAPPRPGPAGLLSAFDRLEEATRLVTDDAPDDLTARRVESDDDAVQIMTAYAAKGLEFPVVACPTLWRPRGASTVTVYRDATTHRRTIDVTKEAWPDEAGQKARRALAEREALGHDLRLLYVALTRARHLNLLWWATIRNGEATGLAHVLFARDADGAVDPVLFDEAKVPLPEDDATADVLGPVLAPAGELVELVEVGPAPPEPRRWTGAGSPGREALAVAALDRPFDRTRRRHSFTSLTAADRDHRPDPVDPSLGDAGATDEAGPADPAPDGDPAGGAAGPPAADGSLVLGAIRGGTRFGTLVHHVLEHVDFTAADLGTEVGVQVDLQLEAAPFPVEREVLVEGLRSALTTPLGPIADGLPLAAIPRADRLDELDFHLVLGEGGAPVDDTEVGAAIAGHLAPDHPLGDWARSLAGGRFGATLAGQLVGSIDAVLRVRGASGDRFLVVDYKTNDLRRRGAQAATLADYHPERLPAAMCAHRYPLQALLYQVALHRYLRWRLPGYRPEDHLGGIAYLFVRGMVGPDAPTVAGTPHGVFAWQPPAALVGELSDLLDGRAP